MHYLKYCFKIIVNFFEKKFLTHFSSLKCYLNKNFLDFNLFTIIEHNIILINFVEYLFILNFRFPNYHLLIPVIYPIKNNHHFHIHPHFIHLDIIMILSKQYF